MQKKVLSILIQSEIKTDIFGFYSLDSFHQGLNPKPYVCRGVFGSNYSILRLGSDLFCRSFQNVVKVLNLLVFKLLSLAIDRLDFFRQGLNRKFFITRHAFL